MYNTDEIVKVVVNEMIKNGATADEIAKMEICLQYIGNEDFRKALNDFVFNTTYHQN